MIQCAGRLLLGRVGPGGVREGKSPLVVKTILLYFSVMVFYVLLVNSGLLFKMEYIFDAVSVGSPASFL